MVGDSLPVAIGPGLNGSFGQVAQSDSAGAAILTEMGKASTTSNFDATSPYSMESYDAAALIMLAIAASGSTDGKVYKDALLEVANGPADGSGVPIMPGELGKALELIAAGTAINYEGGSGVTLIGAGESAGRYRQFDIVDGKYETVQFR
jgi:branched-chain amino acid transport system substrate-binding protein